MTDVVTLDNEIAIILTADDTQVLSVEGEVLVVSAGEQGPPGPPGASGVVTSTHIAATALGGHRFVLISAAGAGYASSDTPAHFGRVIGMTVGAADVGEPATVQSSGKITEPSWSWDTSKPVFLGTNGVPTQVAPAAPSFMQVVGFPVSPTTLYIDLREPVSLA